jgi:hypothetical protein
VRTRVLSCLVFAALLTGCGGGQTDAQKMAATLSGADKIAADKNPQCKLFTPAELSKFVGTPLSPGKDAAMGSGCQWEAVSGTGSAMIQVVPADYHEPHSGAKGFRNVPDVGTRGFVEQELGGWNAGAISGTESVVVSIDGSAATDSTAIELLKETIKRRTK